MNFSINFKTKWADFDANNHMRHTAYNDYAAESRVRFLNSSQLSLADLNKLRIGPVLFKETTSFYREISLGEDIKIELSIKGLSEDCERFKFYHKILKENGVLAAEIEIFGAWMDLDKRKLTPPPQEMVDVLNDLVKTEDFEIIKKGMNK